jgi:hypothetical protein
LPQTLQAGRRRGHPGSTLRDVLSEDGRGFYDLTASGRRRSGKSCQTEGDDHRGQEVGEHSHQFPDDTSTTGRCARVAPEDVYYDGWRKDPGLRDLVESDGGIFCGREFERSCAMSGRVSTSVLEQYRSAGN